MSLVTIIGRGHSGTRAISHTLYASGVYMGAYLNRSGDLVPPEDMYAACKLLPLHVEWDGDLTWNFDALHTMPIPQEFTELFYRYISSVLEEDERHPDRLCGWKIPETTLAFPWIRRLLPDMKYIFWIRDPRDSILGSHLTDNMARFGIPHPEIPDDAPHALYRRRAISWKYQYDLVRATPKPKHWLEVRFEDFVLNQEATLKRLEEFLDIPLARIVVRPDSVARWTHSDDVPDFDFIRPALQENDYLAAPG
jgi:hypothetical protein